MPNYHVQIDRHDHFIVHIFADSENDIANLNDEQLHALCDNSCPEDYSTIWVQEIDHRDTCDEQESDLDLRTSALTAEEV